MAENRDDLLKLTIMGKAKTL